MTKILLHTTIFVFVSIINIAAKNLEIKPLASINNTIVTNLDLFHEIKLIEVIENKKITLKTQNLILKKLINETIKKKETEEININKNQAKIIENQIISIINKIEKENLSIDFDLKQKLRRKLEISFKWEKLIYLKFKNKIDINLNEIDLIIENNINKKNINKEDIINYEKQKKLQTISKSYFDQIKRKYLIEFY